MNTVSFTRETLFYPISQFIVAPSPNTVGRLSADSRKSAASSPSQHHQSEQQQSQRKRPSSAASHPGSPASFHSSHSHHSTKGKTNAAAKYSLRVDDEMKSIQQTSPKQTAAFNNGFH